MQHSHLPFKLRALGYLLASLFALRAEAQTVSPDTHFASPSDVQDESIQQVIIHSSRLDGVRNGVSKETGGITYNINEQDIQALPMGASTPINEVMLQTPGAAQDAQGQVHFRGDHGNIQYRINGVALPDSVSGLAPTLDAHFANSINFITGALPAQYGLRTASVIDIQTADFEEDDAHAHVGSVIGSHQHREFNADTAGRSGDWQYFVTATQLSNQLGLNNVTSDSFAIHDQTSQGRYFGLASLRVDNANRLSVMSGLSNVNLQIPNIPGQVAPYSISGTTTPSSSSLNANQQERNQFEVLSWDHAADHALGYQLSVFHRLSTTQYTPDALGDLLYNGVAANIARQNDAYGLQWDAHEKMTPAHTLRVGLSYLHENMVVNNTSTVFDANNNALNIVDNHQFGGNTWGLYAQDEYKITPDLIFNYGLRYDSVDTITNEHQWSPRLGLIYDSNPQTRWHVGFARYFTPPPTEKIDTTSIGLFQNTSNATPSTGDSPVLAERSSYYDLGVVHSLSNALSVGMNAYYKDVQHLLDEGQFGNALVYSAFNYSQGKVWGLEWSANYHHEDWASYVNLARSTAYGKGIESGQFNFSADELNYISNNWVHLDHDQMWTASAGLSYKQAQRTYTLDSVAGTGMRSGEDNLNHLPAYLTLNTALIQNFKSDEWGNNTARVSIINLLDRTYELRDGSGIGVGAVQWGQRRSLYVGVSHIFD